MKDRRAEDESGIIAGQGNIGHDGETCTDAQANLTQPGKIALERAEHVDDRNITSAPRFLDRNEYSHIRDIIIEAFGNDEEFNELFFGRINDDGSCAGTINRDEIVAVEVDGRIVASAQYMIVKVVPKDACEGGSDKAYLVPYILCVCTTPAYRHRGYMDAMLTLIIERLKREGYPWCFLAPVDTAIYRHLGFDTDWGLTMEERRIIYADDEGLEMASAKLLNADHIEPVRICERV